jgi:hypothetical protein
MVYFYKDTCQIGTCGFGFARKIWAELQLFYECPENSGFRGLGCAATNGEIASKGWRVIK